MTASRRSDREAGYSLVELMIVTVLLGILASLAIPQYLANVREARTVQCRANRGALERSVFNYIERENLRAGQATPSIPQLIRDGVLSTEPLCTAGGVYYWIDTSVPDDGMPRVGCSIHYAP